MSTVDATTRTAFKATYGRAAPTEYPAEPVSACPVDARCHMLLWARKMRPNVACATIADVARGAPGKPTEPVCAWVTFQLCTRDEMRPAWEAFERRRRIAVVDTDAGIARETLANRFIGTVAICALDSLRPPRTTSSNATWLRDLERAVRGVTKVLASRPSLDQLDLIPGTKPIDRTARLSDALRAYHGRLAGLRDLSPGRARPHPERRAFAVALTRWCKQFLDADCQSIVAATVTVLFGVDYSTRQLRRDLQDSKPAAI
jgi:hypothetical protein